MAASGTQNGARRPRVYRTAPAFYRDWIVDNDGRTYRRVSHILHPDEAEMLGTREAAEAYFNEALREMSGEVFRSLDEGEVIRVEDLKFPLYLRPDDVVETRVLSPEEVREGLEADRRLFEELGGETGQ